MATSASCALDAGADDYLTKPFGIGELLARIRALLRCSTPVLDQPIVTTEHFRIDLTIHTIVTLPDEAPVRLTPIEWSIVGYLVRNAERLVAKRQLIDAVWSPSYDPDPTIVRVHITHICRKLEPEPRPLATSSRSLGWVSDSFPGPQPKNADSNVS